jgi:hypothetical protein
MLVDEVGDLVAARPTVGPCAANPADRIDGVSTVGDHVANLGIGDGVAEAEDHGGNLDNGRRSEIENYFQLRPLSRDHAVALSPLRTDERTWCSASRSSGQRGGCGFSGLMAFGGTVVSVRLGSRSGSPVGSTPGPDRVVGVEGAAGPGSTGTLSKILPALRWSGVRFFWRSNGVGTSLPGSGVVSG